MASSTGITIKRPSHKFVDRPMAYTVWIDGEEVGAVHNGEAQRFSVDPGVHHVRLGISGRALGSGRIWTSQDEAVEAEAGAETHLLCSPKPFKGIIRPHHRLDLSQTSSAL